MSETILSDSLYLGFDLSTQSLTAVAVDESGSQVDIHSVNFENELLAHKQPVFRRPPYSTMPARLFVEALDLLLENMKSNSFPFHRVRAVSGAAQQHGTAYLTSEFEPTLRMLDSQEPMLPQISGSCFAFEQCPIWEDSSTAEECEVLQQGLGGLTAMANATGSRATLRFAGPQILAKYNREPESFASVARVTLISSYLGSLLAGHFVPEDTAEACGTHLFDLRSNPPSWLETAVRLVKADGKLCQAPVNSFTVVGSVSHYFVEKFAFPQKTPLIVLTGDNPGSLSALPSFKSGDLLISLGTSDTVQWLVNEDELERSTPRGAAIAMTFRFAMTTKSDSYVRMLVYANGSLTREAVRDGEFGLGNNQSPNKITWNKFEDIVNIVPPGCEPKKVGIFHFRPEIIPRAPAEKTARVVNAKTGEETNATFEELCRLVLQWRALVFKSHLKELGITAVSRIIVTGGAANSTVIPQILADVLEAPVYRLQETASAAVGAARRARVGLLMHKGYQASLALESEQKGMKVVATPRADIVEMYRNSLIPAHQAAFEQWSI